MKSSKLSEILSLIPNWAYIIIRRKDREAYRGLAFLLKEYPDEMYTRGITGKELVTRIDVSEEVWPKDYRKNGFPGPIDPECTRSFYFKDMETRGYIGIDTA